MTNTNSEAETISRPIIHCNLDLATIGAAFQEVLEKIKWKVAFGLNGGERVANEDLDLPLTPIQVSPASNLKPELHQAKSSFKCWILSNGFRDCAEAFHTFLEEIYRDCTLIQLAGGGFIPSEALADKVDLPCATFHKHNFPAKLKALQDNFGIFFNEDTLSCAASLNKARNCLSHRDGLIGKQDCISGSTEFRLRWRAVMLSTNDGTEVEFGKPVGPNKGIYLGFPIRERSYSLGTSFDFNSRDFAEFIMTYVLLSMEGREQVIKYAQSVSFIIS